MKEPQYKRRDIGTALVELQSSYAAARASRFRKRRPGLIPTGSGADYHYTTGIDFWTMLETARAMDRDDVLISQAIDRAVANTIQEGFLLNPKTGDEGLDEELFNRWTEWCADPESCDLAGENTFGQMESLVLRHTLLDGDIVALPNEGGGLELVEAHRIRTPRTSRNVIHGVLVNPKTRSRDEYWMTREDNGATGSAQPLVRDMVRFPTRDADGNRQVFHVYRAKRVSQTRGVTALHPIFDTVSMFDDVCFAKLVQQQVASCFAILRTRSVDAEVGAPPALGPTTQTVTGSFTQTEQAIQPGMEVTGEPGEDLKGFSPNIPNPEFFPHAQLVMTLIAINLGLPLALLTLDARQTNFSGWRGAVDQARLGFRHNQRVIRDRFHVPTYRWKLRQWGADDPRIRDRLNNAATFAHEWSLPSWPYIEPLKDATADLMRVKNVLISPRRLHAERGRDWSAIATETVEDNAFAIDEARARAAAMNAATPDQPIHWRELLTLPAPAGMKITVEDGADSNVETE